MKKIRFGDMRWPEIDEVLKKPNVLILPVGATEQHGRHLPVDFDYYSTTYLAEQAARRVTDENNIHVLVAPTIPYGETFGRPPFEKQLPGSITIGLDTLIRLIKDVVWSLVEQGFKNILVLNGHLENTAPIEVALREVNIEFKELKGLGLYATNSFLMARHIWAELAQGGKRPAIGHAGINETCVAMVIEPENVEVGVTYEGTSTFSLPPKYVLPVGGALVFYHSRVGGVRDSGMHLKDPSATKELGEKFIAAVVDELIEIIVGIAKSEGMTHEEKV